MRLGWLDHRSIHQNSVFWLVGFVEGSSHAFGEGGKDDDVGITNGDVVLLFELFDGVF